MANLEQIAQLLARTESELRQLDLWQTIAPPPQALQSTEAFCLDTLKLSEWLQWIFLPRMQALLDGNLSLPNNCGIHPLAEEYFSGSEQDVKPLLNTLLELDQALS